MCVWVGGCVCASLKCWWGDVLRDLLCKCACVLWPPSLMRTHHSYHPLHTSLISPPLRYMLTHHSYISLMCTHTTLISPPLMCTHITYVSPLSFAHTSLMSPPSHIHTHHSYLPPLICTRITHISPLSYAHTSLISPPSFMHTHHSCLSCAHTLASDYPQPGHHHRGHEVPEACDEEAVHPCAPSVYTVQRCV